MSALSVQSVIHLGCFSRDGDKTTEYLVQYKVNGKTHDVQAFYSSDEGWYVITAQLDGAMADYFGKNFREMEGKHREKYRTELAKLLVKAIKAFKA